MPFLLLYWKYLAAALILAALVAFYNLHVNGLIKTAVDKAVIERDASWRDSEAKAIAKARADAVIVEQAHQQAIDAIQTQAVKDKANAKIQHDKDVAAARSGTLRLRVAASLCPSGANMSGPAAPASGSNASPSSGELPQPIVEGLFGLANSADALTAQLTACQAVILSDRQLLKGSP